MASSCVLPRHFDTRLLDYPDDFIKIVYNLPAYAVEGEWTFAEKAVFLQCADSASGNLAEYAFGDETPGYCIFVSVTLKCACHNISTIGKAWLIEQCRNTTATPRKHHKKEEQRG
jgi:hypothetical protein